MRVTKVKYLEKYKLELSFNNNKSKIVDFENKLKTAKGIFLPLKDPEYFKQVELDDCHLSIIWPKSVATEYDRDALLLNFVLNGEKFFSILNNMAKNFYTFITII